MNGATERSQGELDGDLAIEVIALPLENLVVAHVHHDVKIAGFAAHYPRLAIAGGPEFITRIDARRDAHVDLGGFIQPTFAMTLDADFFKFLSGAMAGRARLPHMKE